MGAQGSQPGDAPGFNGPRVGTPSVAPQQQNPAAESQPRQNRHGTPASEAPRDGSGGQAMRLPWGATAPSTAWNVPRNNGPQIGTGATMPPPGSMAALNNSMAHVSAAMQTDLAIPQGAPSL